MKPPIHTDDLNLSPRVRSLIGILKDAYPSAEAAIEDYRRHLEEKYLRNDSGDGVS
jgi:hypothetical protein